MGKFFVRALAVIGGVFVALSLLICVSVWHFANHPQAMPSAPKTMVLELDFTKPVVERANNSLSLSTLMQNDEETPLLDIIGALDKAKDDPRVKGVVAKFGAEQPSFVHAEEIRAALQRFRQSGKFSYAFAASYGDFGAGNRDYYLASSFENIWLQPVGTVSLTGIGIEAPFAKTALNSIGVTSDFMRREDYKSVMENVNRDNFSPPVRENMTAMLNSLSEQQIDGIAENRGITHDKARDIINAGPYTAAESLKAGLITRVGYDDEMLKEAKDKAGKEAEQVDAETYLDYAPESAAPKATVALIDGIGMIADAPSGGPSRQIMDDQVIDTDAVSQAFQDAADDKDVKAILFRVDSPGGSPTASETIRHALVKAKAAGKPVFVSMGEVAASGGYWIAMDADHIVAEPATITGSIGVVAGKFVLGGLMQKLGISWDSIVTSDNAKMWSPLAAFNQHGRERVNALLDDTYRAFTDNVATARHIPPEKMPDIAKGRVWTGEQAVKIGLVDELGGMKTTVSALKKRLNLADSDQITLKPFPAPESPTTVALKLLRNFGTEGATLGRFSGVVQNAEAVLRPVADALSPTGLISARVSAGIMDQGR